MVAVLRNKRDYSSKCLSESEYDESDWDDEVNDSELNLLDLLKFSSPAKLIIRLFSGEFLFDLLFFTGVVLSSFVFI